MSAELVKKSAAHGQAVKTADELEEGRMPLMAHLIELRNRLLIAIGGWVVAFFLCFAFSGPIINFLVDPLYQLLSNDPAVLAAGKDIRLIFTGLPEKFFAQMKAAAFVGTIIISPVLLGQIWAFIAPGLYKNERRAFLPFLVASPVLFLLGGALVYYVIMPFAWGFFLNGQQIGEAGKIDIVLEARISEYLNLVMRLVLAFGFCFQLPVAATLMGRVGLISSKGMIAARRYAIVAVFLVAALFTPPDPLSMLSLGIPVVILYELSVWLVKGVERKRAEEADEDADDDYEDFFGSDGDEEDEEERADKAEHGGTGNANNTKGSKP